MLYRVVQCAPPAGEYDGLLSVPALVVSHDLGMQRDIMRRELGQLIGLGVDPAQWLHVLGREQEEGRKGE